MLSCVYEGHLFLAGFHFMGLLDLVFLILASRVTNWLVAFVDQ
jgi:hypothetical protein